MKKNLECMFGICFYDIERGEKTLHYAEPVMAVYDTFKINIAKAKEYVSRNKKALNGKLQDEIDNSSVSEKICILEKLPSIENFFEVYSENIKFHHYYDNDRLYDEVKSMLRDLEKIIQVIDLEEQMMK